MNVPGRLVDGFTKLKGAFPNVFKGTEKLVKTVVNGFTWSVSVMVEDAKLFQLA